jgi:hypothetical protein
MKEPSMPQSVQHLALARRDPEDDLDWVDDDDDDDEDEIDFSGEQDASSPR